MPESIPEEELLEQIKSSEGLDKSDSLFDLGNTYFEKKKYYDAYNAYNASLDQAIATDPEVDRTFLITIANNAGRALLFLNRYEEAAAHFTKAAEWADEIGDEDACEVHTEAGHCWFEVEQYEKAQFHFSRALTSAPPESHWVEVATLTRNVAMAEFMLEHFGESLNQLLEAKNLYQLIKNPDGVALCEKDIARCYFKLGEGALALESAERALDYANFTKENHCLFWANHTMGLAKYLLEEFEEAESYLDQAKECGLLIEPRDWRTILEGENIRANCLAKLGLDSEEAEVRLGIMTINETVFADL